MDRQKIEDKYFAGNVIQEFSDYGLLVISVRVAYICLGIWALYKSMQGPPAGERLIDYVILLFALWRICRQGQNKLYLCEKGLVVLRRPVDIGERMEAFWDDEQFYFFVEYSQVMGFAEGWEYLHIGIPEEGGLLVVPVDLQYLRHKDKTFIAEYIEAQQSGNAE